VCGSGGKAPRIPNFGTRWMEVSDQIHPPCPEKQHLLT